MNRSLIRQSLSCALYLDVWELRLWPAPIRLVVVVIVVLPPADVLDLPEDHAEEGGVGGYHQTAGEPGLAQGDLGRGTR